jgi:hypothetical protein
VSEIVHAKLPILFGLMDGHLENAHEQPHKRKADQHREIDQGRRNPGIKMQFICICDQSHSSWKYQTDQHHVSVFKGEWCGIVKQ